MVWLSYTHQTGFHLLLNVFSIEKGIYSSKIRCWTRKVILILQQASGPKFIPSGLRLILIHDVLNFKNDSGLLD